MGKFVYFTSAEKRQANEVDLPSFLRDRGEKLLQAGREYRLASDHSITVRANRWYDHAARRGGHAISFVRQFYDKTFPEAVSMLLGRDGHGIIPIAKQEPEPQEPKPFALPKPYLTMRRMYAYPKLIGEEQLIAANEKRSNKPQLPKKTEAQKVLRRLCGTPLSERVEQSVTDLLNSLANCPDRIRHQRSPAPATHPKTQEALDNALEQQPIDEDNAKALILRLAAEQYAALGNEEYETTRLRHLFSAFECVAELNADLLKSTVSEVQVTRQNVKLRLKNGQVIERSDLQ